jgi:hypothetical protein
MARLTKKQAQAMWDRVWQTLSDHEAAIREVIDKKAWLPLGFETFADAWFGLNHNDISLARELRPHVVVQLLSEGLTEDEVADAVKGIGPELAARINKERKAGVPADQMSLVKQHSRLTRPHTLHIYVGAEQMEEFHRIVTSLGYPSTHVLAVALEAVEKRFRALANELSSNEPG